MGDITQILREWDRDKTFAIQQLTPLVYGELHKIASAYMRNARPDHTLQPTALINEAYLRLVQQDGARYSDRAHFFALAAKVMRGILVDFARARASEKRGSGREMQLDQGIDVSRGGAADFLVIHEAIERLKAFRQTQGIRHRAPILWRDEFRRDRRSAIRLGDHR
jgi:RNA polymerase sigma factor (TIGR02999 family)